MNEDKVRAAFSAWHTTTLAQFENDATQCSPEPDMYEAYRASYAQARREALEEALEIVCEAKENICAGGLAENRQYEESIAGPHLDGVADEIYALIKD